MEIRLFEERFLSGIVDLQNRLAPPRRQTNLLATKDTLTDLARDRGKNVRLAFDSDELCGLLAWVKGSGGEFFGSPFVVGNAPAARMLVDLLLAQAQGRSRVRVSAFPEEQAKAAALREGGFDPQFEFIEFETDLAVYEVVTLPGGIVDQSVVTMHSSEFAQLHNESFRAVDNSLLIGIEEAQEILSSPRLAPTLSRVWRSHSSRAIAFSLVNKDGYLDAIGVVPSAQKSGLGTQLYSWILAQAFSEGIKKISTTVSSRNESSLRLHRRLKMNEVERRVVWEKKQPSLT